MLDNLTLSHFRGFRKISFPELKQFTLLSGRNNVGKSSVLEGIFLLVDHVAGESFAKINTFRGNPYFSNAAVLWEPLFYGMDAKTPIKISSVCKGNKISLVYNRDESFIPSDPKVPPETLNPFAVVAQSTYTLHFSFQYGKYSEDGHFALSQNGTYRNIKTSNSGNIIKDNLRAQFINSMLSVTDSSVVTWFATMELSDTKHHVVDALKVIEPYLTDIVSIAPNGVMQLYGKVNGKILPLKLSGDGINRLLYIVLAIIGNPNSIILIDEIETGFHYSLHGKVWETIAQTAKKNNCQVIATTHSNECLRGAVEGIKAAKAEDDFCYYRIDKTCEQHQTHQFSCDLLAQALSSDMEVR